MKCFASLLYREFRISRKSIIYGMLTCFGFIILFWLVMISIKSDGRFNKSIIENNISGIKKLPIATMFIILYCFSITDTQGNNHKADVSCGWQSYSYTLPVSPLMRALAISAYRLILIISGIILSLINAAAHAIFWNTEFDRSLPPYIFLFLTLLTVFVLPIDFFMFRARNKIDYKKYSTVSYALMVIMMITAAFIFLKANGISLSSLLNSESDTKLRLPSFDTADLLWTVPLFIAVWLLSFGFLYMALKLPCFKDENADSKKSGETLSASLPEVSKGSPTGLFYMELSSNRLMLAICILLPFFASALPFLVCSTYVFSGSKSMADVLDVASNPFVLIAMYLLGVAGISIGLSLLFSNDNKKSFAYFIATTPGGTGRYVRNKYCLCLMINLLLHIGYIVCFLILSAVCHHVINADLYSSASGYICGIFAVMLLFSVELPIFFLFGPKKASMIKLFGIVTAGIIATVIFGFLPESAQEKIMLKISDLAHGNVSLKWLSFKSFGPYLCMLIYYFSMKLSCRLYLKGAEGCE